MLVYRTGADAVRRRPPANAWPGCRARQGRRRPGLAAIIRLFHGDIQTWVRARSAANWRATKQRLYALAIALEAAELVLCISIGDGRRLPGLAAITGRVAGEENRRRAIGRFHRHERRVEALWILRIQHGRDARGRSVATAIPDRERRICRRLFSAGCRDRRPGGA